ncbi:hypothetical protein [Paenibacillus chitinolyticus]|uniref:hypothetical protein n=1 Tax=Paenibacillus chitinolyticus TaxID=79263 RepID=UPI001C4432F1|nr:hypothetical protein [Paenibacillus chitinolyticus]MBV6715446.1 hypothetical protein [Paenibacillus chitinolyticus]
MPLTAIADRKHCLLRQAARPITRLKARTQCQNGRRLRRQEQRPSRRGHPAGRVKPLLTQRSPVSLTTVNEAGLLLCSAGA